MNSSRRGFTLIEMSIVITIIAFIIGTVLLGKSIIVNYQLRSVIADLTRFKNAISMFKEKYHELPGDMPNATSFWGQDVGCAVPISSGAANKLGKTATCNGNGDGIIGNSSDTVVTMNGNDFGESLLAWQHLANAGFIDGSYTGAISSNTGGLDAGINVPRSKFNSNVYTLFYAAPVAVSNVAYDANYRHVIVFGKPISPNGQTIYPNTPSSTPGLNGQDAYNIDLKIDDGIPSTGNILTYMNTGSSPDPNCATSTSYTPNPGACSLIFITGF